MVLVLFVPLVLVATGQSTSFNWKPINPSSEVARKMAVAAVNQYNNNNAGGYVASTLLFKGVVSGRSREDSLPPKSTIYELTLAAKNVSSSSSDLPPSNYWATVAVTSETSVRLVKFTKA